MRRLIFLSIFLMWSMVISVARAEDATRAAELSEPVSVPTSVDQLKSDYFYHLEKYRQTKQQFILDQAEYQQLQTLSTKDKLIDSYKRLLLARSSTLSTYTYPLDKLLRDTQGIDIKDKEQALGQLKDVQNLITHHHQTISSLGEQEDLSTEALRFETDDLPLFLEASYRCLSALAIGRLQIIVDQVEVGVKDFQEEVVNYETDARKRTSYDRGIREIETFRNQATEAVKSARIQYASFDVADRQRGYNPQQIYRSVTDSLNPAYVLLQRSLDYLLELDSRS